jgi:hypothetical protein
MPLSSTQIGAIGENLLINAVMKASEGRLTPFQPLADDCGLDVLFFDKVTGASVAIQLKCRTATIRDPYTGKPTNTVHFHVRKATFDEARRAYLVPALFNEDLTQFIATWFIPMGLLPTLSKDIGGRLVIRPSKSATSADRFSPYRCANPLELSQRILAVCEMTPENGV